MVELVNKGDPLADVLIKEQAKHWVDRSKDKMNEKLKFTEESLLDDRFLA